MSYKRHLFIGGPHDGKILKVKLGTHLVEIPLKKHPECRSKYVIHNGIAIVDHWKDKADLEWEITRALDFVYERLDDAEKKATDYEAALKQIHLELTDKNGLGVEVGEAMKLLDCPFCGSKALHN
jgi:hypothetical protein